MNAQAKLKKLAIFLSPISKHIKSIILVWPLAIIKAQLSELLANPLARDIFLAKALALPPGKTPIGIYDTIFQSGLPNNAFIASWGKPSPETNTIPLTFDKFSCDKYS